MCLHPYANGSIAATAAGSGRSSGSGPTMCGPRRAPRRRSSTHGAGPSSSCCIRAPATPRARRRAHRQRPGQAPQLSRQCRALPPASSRVQTAAALRQPRERAAFQMQRLMGAQTQTAAGRRGRRGAAASPRPGAGASRGRSWGCPRRRRGRVARGPASTCAAWSADSRRQASSQRRASSRKQLDSRQRMSPGHQPRRSRRRRRRGRRRQRRQNRLRQSSNSPGENAQGCHCPPARDRGLTD